MGWPKGLWSTEWRGFTPPFSKLVRNMKHENILSVLIDESGDFGKLDNNNPYYYVIMVLHEQKDDIKGRVDALETKVKNWGFENHYIHVGPLIRREKPYLDEPREERRALFNALFHFARAVPIQYLKISMDKRECSEHSPVEYTDKLSKMISMELRQHREYFDTFDRIIVYYDYGQGELAKILVSVFNALFSNVEIRKALPTNYRLLQVADLLCTVEMIADKDVLTKSEDEFFFSKRDFKKNILKPMEKKKM